MKKLISLSFVAGALALIFGLAQPVAAKSYIKSYSRRSGTSVRSYTRYKADGYRFNNYRYRPDRGYRR